MRFSSLFLMLISTLIMYADIPVGYYDKAEGKKDAELKAAMHAIIAPHTRIEYGSNGTWEVFRTSDVRADGSIWDMYSAVVRYFPDSGSHPDMHIEHCVPKSWWGEESSFIYDASFDLHHLVPADASANMSKGNRILGVVDESIDKPTLDNGVSKSGKARIGDVIHSVFEPHDDYKGDFARMYMYVVTCYQDYTWQSNGVNMFNTEAYPTLNEYARELLMDWHRLDPVSVKEIDRNEVVYSVQNNRNPFIDFPLLAEYLWGDSIGCAFTTDVLVAPVDISIDELSYNKIECSWSEVSAAEAYEVNCTTTQGEDPVTVSEGFDEVSTNGKPLPAGWSGNASGNYTSEAGSGISAPSVALKNSGEYIETPEYEAPVTAMSFMYRFASTATGSSLLVEYMKDGSWLTLQTIEYVNTTKKNIDFVFDVSDNVRAFRFTYNKSKGNMAIDDVVVTYGALEEVPVIDLMSVNEPYAMLENLRGNTSYNIRVRSVMGDCCSAWSEPVTVTTQQYPASVSMLNESDIRYTVSRHTIAFYNLPIGSCLFLYNMQGVLCYQGVVDNGVIFANVKNKGVYIAKIVNNLRFSCLKVAVLCNE